MSELLPECVPVKLGVNNEILCPRCGASDMESSHLEYYDRAEGYSNLTTIDERGEIGLPLNRKKNDGRGTDNRSPDGWSAAALFMCNTCKWTHAVWIIRRGLTIRLMVSPNEDYAGPAGMELRVAP